MRIPCVLSTFFRFCGGKGTVGSKSHQIPSHGGVAICSHPKMGRFILNYSRVAALLNQKNISQSSVLFGPRLRYHVLAIEVCPSVETSEETSFLPELPSGILREWSRRLSITSRWERSTGTRAWSGVFISLNQFVCLFVNSLFLSGC